MRAMTPDSYEDAFVALRSTVEHEPEYGPAWSALANLFNHAYIRHVPDIPDPLVKASFSNRETS
jgi:hypothetical protein